MFELKFTEEQNMLRDMAREFTNNEIKPIASQIDTEAKIPDELIKKIYWGNYEIIGKYFQQNISILYSISFYY